MKRQPPPSPSSLSSDDDRAKLLACTSVPPPRKRSRGRPPRAPSRSPSLSPSPRPIPTPTDDTTPHLKRRVARLLDSYLEQALGTNDDQQTTTNDTLNSKDDQPSDTQNIPFASINNEQAITGFRLFHDSRPGNIGRNSIVESESSKVSDQKDEINKKEENDDEDTSDEETKLAKLRSVVVDAPPPPPKTRA